MNITVLYVRDTANVLAAVTRTAPATTVPAVAELVGTGLRTRALGTETLDVTVPADDLATATVDADGRVFDDLRGYVVVESPQPDGTLKTELSQLPPASGQSVTFTANVVSVDIAGSGGTGVKVLVVLEKASSPAPAPVILTGTVPNLDTQVALPASLDTGTWRAAVFATGRRPFAHQGTVP
jgi:hypothetical protein